MIKTEKKNKQAALGRLCLGDLYDSVFFIFFCKPVVVVEGMSLRAAYI